MEQVDGRLHRSQPGLIKKLITTAELQTASDLCEFLCALTGMKLNRTRLLAVRGGSFALSLRGMLIFLLRTRPDIAFAVNTLATRCAGATLRDHEVILYLKCTAHLELSYNPTDPDLCHTVGRLYGWADAAYACHRDGKSHSGMCLSYGLRGTGKQVQQYQQEAVSCLPQFDRG